MSSCTPPTIEPIAQSFCNPVPTARPPAWPEKDEFSPYNDPRNCEYSIVVDRDSSGNQHSSLGTGGSPRIQSYIEYGVGRLMEFYGKVPSGADRASLISDARNNYDTAVAAGEIRHYIPARPGSKVRLLVTVSYDKFNDVPDLTSYREDPSLPTSTSFTFDVRKLATQIEFVAKVIKEHYKAKGGLFKSPNLNLKSEAKKMESFVDFLQRFLNYNKIKIDLRSPSSSRHEHIEFIIDSNNFRLIDIIYKFQNGDTKFLRAGWPIITSPRSMKTFTSRTVALVYWTEVELFELFNNHKNPTTREFIEKYIYPPVDANMTIGSSFGLDSSHLRDLNEGLQGAAMVLGMAEWGMDIMHGDDSLMPLADSAVKTWAELQFENDNILNETFQSNLAYRSDNIFHTDADTGPFFDMATLFDRVDGASEDLFAMILNHVDVRYIVAKVALCLGLDPQSTEIDPWFLELLRTIVEFLNMLANINWATFALPIDFLQVGLDITEDLVNYVINFLIELIVGLLTRLILKFLEALDRLCEEDFDYDSVNIDALLSDSFSSPKEAADFYNSLASGLGEGLGTSELLRELIADISAVLSTSEICSLFKGSASSRTLSVVYGIAMQDKYSAFHESLDSREEITRLFSSLGELINPSLCDLPLLMSGDLCEYGFNEEIVRSLLSNNGVPSPEVEQQIAAERARREQLMAEIADVVNLGEEALTQKLLDVLRNSGEIGKQISNHASTQESISQMVQAAFYGPIVTLARDGFGIIETPYDTIEYEIEISPGNRVKIRRLFPSNRGIMHIITDAEQISYFKFKDGFSGIVEQLPWMSFNDFTTPDLGTSGGGKVEVRLTEPAGIAMWAYLNHSYRYVGDFSTFESERSVETRYQVAYDTEGPLNVPSWWSVDVARNLDRPRIVANFIFRGPLFGLPSPEEYNYGAVGFPIGDYTAFEKTRFFSIQDRILRLYPDPLRSRTVQHIDTEIFKSLSHDRFLYAYPEGPGEHIYIDVFNDLPKVFEQESTSRLIPDYDHPDFIFPIGGTLPWKFHKQKSTYLNFISTVLRDYGELFSSYRSEPDPFDYFTVTHMEYLRDTYDYIFNDVMRILYRFVTDSEFYRPSQPEMLNSLRSRLKDPQQIKGILGVEAIRNALKGSVASTLEGDENLSDASEKIIGKAALVFMIRIYIFEFFIKNIYMFVQFPDRRSYPRSFRDDKTNANPLNVDNTVPPPPGSIEEIFFRRDERTLNIEDTSDPILVSYLTEYIVATSSRTRVPCNSFLEIAQKLAEDELQDSAGSFLSVSGYDSEKDDTLAYYPNREFPGDKTAALKYYVAQDLKDFLKELQKFVEIKNFDLSGAWPSEDRPKRTLILSFLDKFQINGFNFNFGSEAPGGVTAPEWARHGEGLYMEFYFRRHTPTPGFAEDELDSVRFVNDLAERPEDFLTMPTNPESGKLSDVNVFGLRMCVRDSVFHEPDPGAPPPAVSVNFRQATETLRLVAGDPASGGLGINVIEKTWNRQKGFPILQYEATWSEIKANVELTAGDSAYASEPDRKAILDYLKLKLSQTDEFRVMFEYVFPIKKLFNFSLVQMNQNIDAFLTNPAARGPEMETEVTDLVNFSAAADTDIHELGMFSNQNDAPLRTSCIDPEQFRNAKAMVRSILENLNNPGNYRYLNAEYEDDGSIADQSLRRTLEEN